MIQELGQALSNDLVEAFRASGLKSISGATVAALSVVNEPERTASGWKIGVGDQEALGDENEPAPEGTLRAFVKDFSLKPVRAWKYLDNDAKQTLAIMRRAGQYGGKGWKYANYMWVQNKGNPRAHIDGRGFIEAGVAKFQAEAPELINNWWTSLGAGGRFARTVKGIFGR